MIKLIHCIRRRDGVSEEEFLEFWDRLDLTRRDLAESLGAVRMVKNRRLHVAANYEWAGGHARAKQFDGVFEIWFESTEKLRDAFETPAFKVLGRRLVEAGERIIDRDASTMFFAEEETILAADGE